MRFILLLLLVTSSVFSQTKPNIAVNDFYPQGIEVSEGSVISERFRSELVNTGAFRVMERSQMESILKEQGFQQSGACTDNACIISMGQLLGVERFIVGSIGRVGSMITITARMLNVANGEILFSATEDCNGSIEQVLVRSSKNLALKFLQFVEKGEFAAVSLQSRPEGALVKMNGESKGAAPLEVSRIVPGNYLFSLSMKDFADTSFSVNLAKGEQKEFSLNLHYSEAYLKAESGKVLRMKWTRRAVLAAVSVGFIIAGNHFNNRSDEAFGSYMALNTISDHGSAYDEVTKYERYRNVFYGAAAVMGGITLITFAF